MTAMNEKASSGASFCTNEPASSSLSRVLHQLTSSASRCAIRLIESRSLACQMA